LTIYRTWLRPPTPTKQEDTSVDIHGKIFKYTFPFYCLWMMQQMPQNAANKTPKNKDLVETRHRVAQVSDEYQILTT